MRNLKNSPGKKRSAQIRLVLKEFNATKLGQKHRFAAFPLDIFHKQKFAVNATSCYDIVIWGQKFDATFRFEFNIRKELIDITIIETDYPQDHMTPQVNRNIAKVLVALKDAIVDMKTTQAFQKLFGKTGGE